MIKKICAAALTLVILLSLFSVPAFAASNDTPDYFVTITRPEENKDITSYSTYAIAGTSKAYDVSVTVYKWDSGKEKYVRFADVDDESSWKMNDGGYFQRSFYLHKGANKFRVEATKKGSSRTQMTYFTITRIDSTFSDSIDVFGDIFRKY
jgi:hypothetical protein